MKSAVVLLVGALAAGGGCRLDPLAHDECRTDEDCVSSRVCLSGRCHPRGIGGGADAGVDAAVDGAVSSTSDTAEAPSPDAGEPPADATGALDAAEPPAVKRRYQGMVDPFLWLGNGLSDHAPAVTSPRPWRTDHYLIGLDGRIVHGAFLDGALPGFSPLNGERMVGGLDATSWGLPRFDVIARGEDGQLRHAAAELGVNLGQWVWGKIPGVQGQLRPALAHLGQGRLVAFQIARDGKVCFAGFAAGKWGAWKISDLTATGGLDATTLSSGGQARAIRLVALDEAQRPVTALFTPEPEALLAPWDPLGEPPTGSAAWPSIASFGQRTDQYDVLVTSKQGTLWRRSFPAPEGESGWVEVSGTGQTNGAVDVAALSLAPASGERIEILRRKGNQAEWGFIVVETVP